jgi:glycine cleavage system protein P-like pyridoxal-binding family
VIEDIRRLMVESAETASKEKLGRKAAAMQQQKQASSSREMERMNNSRGWFGIQEDFHS